MIVALVFVVSLVVVVLAAVGRIHVLLALPAIGVAIAVCVGYLARRDSGPAPP